MTEEVKNMVPTASDQTGCEGASVDMVKHTIRHLTPVQRKFVKDATIHGTFTMATVQRLKSKGLFHFVATSPNGQCGPMRLTPFGERVRAAILAQGARQ